MLNLVANGPSGYNLTNSLRFRSSASAYLNRTPSVTGNQQKFTWSGWIKLGSFTSLPLFGSGTNAALADYIAFFFNGSSQFQVNMYLSGFYGSVWNPVFRDPSAWYHFIIAVDTTQATASNRVLLYVNGVLQTGSSHSNGYIPQNTNIGITKASVPTYIGTDKDAGAYNGYMTEINFIDGQALTPSSFGSTNSTTGVWQPAKYTGTYGTNGFYLNFSNIALTSGSNTGLGKDYSGNGNYWNTNNISVTAGTTYDAMTDVPTLTSATVANYCVGNPLYKPSTQSTLSSRYANLDWGQAATNSVGSVAATMAMTSGKYYWEVTIGGSFNQSAIGIQTITETAWRGSGTVLYGSSGNKIIGGSSSAYGATYTTNDVLGFAYDADAGTLVCYKNNTSQGTIYSGGAGNSWLACIHDDNAGAGVTYYHSFNFGQRPFSYTPPTGYVALNTYNLPTSTIVQGNKYMDATLYTGNGTGLSVTNAGAFKPDFLWIKQRSAASSHLLYDSTRGVTHPLWSDLTAAEGTATAGTGVNSFNSNGWTLGTDTSTTGSTNINGNTYVGWQWQAGQGSTSSNTNGSITSTVSVNASAGFSVVTYTGTGANATVGHGLGVAPKMVIVKNRSIASAWRVWFTGFAGTEQLNLNETTAKETGQITWNSTVPTSTVFSLGTPAAVNGSGNTCVAYCWAEIAGFSKFTSFVGNGSSDGPFVYLGFRPKYVIIKNTSIISHWTIEDTSTNPYNVAVNSLYSDTSAAENTTIMSLDFLSNGFKCRNVLANESNVSGSTYIVAAWAENPFKNALAR